MSPVCDKSHHAAVRVGQAVHASPRIVIAVLFAATAVWFVAIASKSVRSASGAWRYGRRSGW